MARAKVDVLPVGRAKTRVARDNYRTSGVSLLLFAVFVDPCRRPDTDGTFVFSAFPNGVDGFRRAPPGATIRYCGSPFPPLDSPL